MALLANCEADERPVGAPCFRFATGIVALLFCVRRPRVVGIAIRVLGAVPMGEPAGLEVGFRIRRKRRSVL